MKGEIIYKILKTLKNEALSHLDFAHAILKAGYGASGNSMRCEFSKIQHKRIKAQIDQEKIRNFKKYLSKLKNGGFIFENTLKQICLSEKGKKKLTYFENSLSLNKSLYKTKNGDKVIIISYDIPIAFNRERNILRDMLRMLGFSLIHKSVWVGKVLLPENFISDLNRLGIRDYVEILEVAKNGTLKSEG